MRIIFAGTPEFARVALEALMQAGLEIALVLTQPDRPSGRGLRLQHSAVKQFALVHKLPLAQPQSLRLEGPHGEQAQQAMAQIRAARADVMVVAAYGLILPPWVLTEPRLGCLNIHASLLPRWRGAAPIQRAIEAGDAQSGITIMQMDAGLDTGAMLLWQALPIATNETSASLHDKLAALGGELIVRTLALAQRGALKPEAQAQSGITYARKIDKAEAAVHWHSSAQEIERRIRAFSPAPLCFALLRGELIKFCAATVVSDAAAQQAAQPPAAPFAPGQIVRADAEGIEVICGNNSRLKITQMQRAGGKRLDASAFLRGFPIEIGACFQ